MRKFGLLGERLGHSLSPQIHKLILAELNLQGDYQLLETPPSQLLTLVNTISQSYSGVNVTVPYKVAVLPEVTHLSPEAAAIGAVNTLRFKGADIFGYNTDYFGFGRMLAQQKLAVQGQRVTVLGSGGAARAVLQYLKDQQPEGLVVVSREPQEAQQRLAQLVPAAEFITYEELAGRAGYLLVNTTPVGMFPKVEASPVPAELVAQYQAVVDIVYNPAETLLLRYAREAQKQYCNGLYMLVAQAVAAQEIWQQRTIGEETIVRIMEKLECL